MDRRTFLNSLALASASLVLPSLVSVRVNSAASVNPMSMVNPVAISQWSFHHSIFGDSRNNYEAFIATLHSDPSRVLQGEMDPREIVVRARELGVDFVDLVNILWFGKHKDTKWLNQFNQMAQDQGVNFICLMCDELGYIGSSSKPKRESAIDRHIQWMETAATLGCSQFRVNAYGDGSYLEQLKQNAESLSRLAEAAQGFGLTLLVENHGHPSSNAAWLAMLMELTASENIGVYLDLDNFFMGGWNHFPERRYDRTQGILDLAPYTKGVSAKSFSFDQHGNEETINYQHCYELLSRTGFSGHICAEFEGTSLSEFEGSKKTVKLIRNTWPLTEHSSSD